MIIIALCLATLVRVLTLSVFTISLTLCLSSCSSLTCSCFQHLSWCKNMQKQTRLLASKPFWKKDVDYILKHKGSNIFLKNHFLISLTLVFLGSEHYCLTVSTFMVESCILLIFQSAVTAAAMSTQKTQE